MTFSIPAHAGFEWTPPEQTAPAPIPEEQNIVTPSVPDPLPPVQKGEHIDDIPQEPEAFVPEQRHEKSSDQQKPVLKVKVLTPQQEPIQKNAVSEELNKPQIDEPKSEQIIKQSKPIEPAIEEPEVIESTNVTPEPDVISKEPIPDEPKPIVTQNKTEPKEITKEVKSKKGVSINPYPLRDSEGDSLPDQENEKTISSLKEPKRDVASFSPSEPQAQNVKLENEYKVIEGFGADIPLAVALSQVVPPQYAYSFGNGVNPGDLVSWNGGKPWNEVLDEMVTPLGIETSIQGNTLKITKSGNVSVAEPLPVVHKDESSLSQEESSGIAQEETLSSLNPDNTKPTNSKDLEKNDKQEKVEKLGDKKEPLEKVSLKQEPVEKVVKEPTKKSGRNVILDPGKSEAKQPNFVEQVLAPEASSEKLAKAEPAASDATKKLEKTEIEATKKEQSLQPRIWEAKQGSSLKETLDVWARQANVKLIWKSEKDYQLSSNVLISGTFDSAVKVLFTKAVKNGPQHSFAADGTQSDLVVEDAQG